VNLAVLYPDAAMPIGWLVARALALLALLTAGALWGARQRQPWLAVGWFWFLGTLVLGTGVVQVGSTVMADRFMYLPQIGLWIAVVWAGAKLAREAIGFRWPFTVAAAMVPAVLMICAWRQVATWRDPATLWTHALACNSENYLAHSNYALYLAKRGQLAEAIEEYGKMLRLQPQSAEGHTNLANALARRGHFREAIDHYRRALELAPSDALAHYNCGYTLARCGQFDAAIAEYEAALRIKPDEPTFRRALAVARAQQERGRKLPPVVPASR
jgi:tetratricopeptide (TPR) repeat protein